MKNCYPYRRQNSGKVYNSYLPCNLYGVSGVSGVGKGWSRGGQGVVKDPMDSTRGVDCGVACGVAIVGWSGVVRVDSHCGVDRGGLGWTGVVWGGQGWSGVDEVTSCIAIAHLSCITIAHLSQLQTTGYRLLGFNMAAPMRRSPLQVAYKICVDCVRETFSGNSIC